MKNYILWDWNGTIIDDVGIALDAVNHMLRLEKLPTITMEEYRKAMGTPILRFYEHFFDMNKIDSDWIAAHFHDYYDGHEEELTLHEGVEAVLRQEKQRGCRQIILSSSATTVIWRYMDKFQLSPYFEELLGAEDYLAASKIERAVKYFQDKKIPPREAVLLGDTVHDYEVAREIGVDCILLTYGHQDKESLLACGCPVYDCLADIPLFNH